MQNKVKVFFDGLCVVCDREISQYKKMRGAESIQFVDIFSSEFSAEMEGLDPKKIHVEMHAKDQAGVLHIGVDAFRLIWSQLHALKWATRVSKVALVDAVLKLGYRAFVRIRPYLPRKACETSPYCDLASRPAKSVLND